MQRGFSSGFAIAVFGLTMGLTMASCKSDDEATTNEPGVESVATPPSPNAHSIWRPAQEARPEDCTLCGGATVDRLDVAELLADGPLVWVYLTHFAVFPEPQEGETPEPELFARVNDCSVPSPPMTGSVPYNRPDEASTLLIDLSDVPDGRVSLALRVFYIEQSLPPLRKVGNQVSLAEDSGAVRTGADGEEVLGVPGPDCPGESGEDQTE